MTPRLILFDIDGTLVMTHGAGRVSTRAAMLETFGTFGQIERHQFSGKTDWFTLVELLTLEGFAQEDIERQIPTFVQNVGKHLNEIIARHPVEACPGSLKAVQDLHNDDSVRLGLVTGNVHTTAPIKLRAAGFNPSWFAVGAYGNDAMERNDLPAIVLERAARHFGHRFTPQEVIVIGDTEMDVACARALGAVAVAVKTGFADEITLINARPDYLLDDLSTFRSVVLNR